MVSARSISLPGFGKWRLPAGVSFFHQPGNHHHTTLTTISRSFGCFLEQNRQFYGKGSVEARLHPGRAATFFPGRLAVPVLGRA